MADEFRVLKIADPADLDGEEMRSLFKRAFHNPSFQVNADELIDFLKREFEHEGSQIHLWIGISRDHGLCALGVVTAWTYPLSPYPFVAHTHSEIHEHRGTLLLEMVKWLLDNGHSKVFTHNVSHLNDRAFAGLFSEHAKAEVLGSLILIAQRD